MTSRRVHLWLAWPLLLLTSLSTGAAPDATTKNYAKEAMAILAPYDKAGLLSGTILVAKEGVTIFQHAYGKTSHEWNLPNTTDTRYLIGSITKQFTAVAILQLVERGSIGLDDPISKFYVAAPASWEKVTIRHLLGHTSGIPNYTSLPTEPADRRNPQTAETLIALVRDKPLQFNPGIGFSYSNSGYVLLGYVIGKASGLTYCEYLERNILVPLNMRDTGCAVTTLAISRLAYGYERQKSGLRKADYIDLSNADSAGQLYSTAADLLLWQTGLTEARVITKASLELVQTDHGNRYGLGFALNLSFDRAQVWHNGRLPGFNSILSTYPQEALTVIYLSNYTDGFVDRVANELTGLFFQASGGYQAKTLIADAEEFARRMQHPAPAAGSEAALRKLIAEFRAAPTRDTGPQKIVTEMGTLESIAFKSVAPDGADVYELQFANGRLEWTILMVRNAVAASGFRKLPSSN